MHSPHKLKLGTRGSLLARTQSSQVAQMLFEKTQTVSELQFIQTQGDQQTEKPLWQMEGKDFFTKELDQALLKGEVDFVVHSYKDLGSDRPDNIHLAALPKRFPAHDILLIRNDVKQRLLKNEIDTLIIGTSSPRRITNLTKGLAPYLPGRPDRNVECKVLRGNVNTRIGKLQNKDYDGIVLAFAGLERLALHPESSKELTALLRGLSVMVLPLSAFPSAASQGALALECRGDDNRTKNILKELHHPPTAGAVALERKAFASYGGGCHLAVGINVQETEAGHLETHLGEVDNSPVQMKKLHSKGPLKTEGPLFVGLPQNKLNKYSSLTEQELIADQLITRTPLAPINIPPKAWTYITSNHTWDALKEHDWQAQQGAVLSAGTKTWEFLARKGVFINASSDSLGEDNLNQLCESALFALLFPEGPKLCLGHSDSFSHWGEATPCYGHEFKTQGLDSFEGLLKEAKSFYWMGATQFEMYAQKFPFIPNQGAHYCGPGKTYMALSEHWKKEGTKAPLTALSGPQDLFRS